MLGDIVAIEMNLVVTIKGFGMISIEQVFLDIVLAGSRQKGPGSIRIFL